MVKLFIDKNWSLQEAFDEINSRYWPGGLSTGPKRNALIYSWGQLAGRTRALSELDSMIKFYGSKNKMAKAIHMSSSSIKKLQDFFYSLPSDLEDLDEIHIHSFIEGERCPYEEDLTHEFKEIKNNNPAKTIQNTINKYIISFLNSNGGSIYWEICDNGKVKSINLNSTQKDEIKKAINNKINTIEPRIDPTRIKVIFHPIENLENQFVIEVKIPKSNDKKLYFNSSGETWVRVNGCSQQLKGIAQQDCIINRM